MSPCSIKISSYSKEVTQTFEILLSFKTSKIALPTPPCFCESLNIYHSLYFFDNSIKVSLSIGFTNLKSKIAISSLCNTSFSIALHTHAATKNIYNNEKTNENYRQNIS